MKRNIIAFWFDINEGSKPRATVMRDRRGDGLNLPSSYTPTKASIQRINELGKELSRSPLSSYSCEVSTYKCILGWVLYRKPNFREMDKAVYPPPSGR